jgi:hypothetical protein
VEKMLNPRLFKIMMEKRYIILNEEGKYNIKG